MNTKINPKISSTTCTKGQDCLVGLNECVWEGGKGDGGWRERKKEKQVLCREGAQ